MPSSAPAPAAPGARPASSAPASSRAGSTRPASSHAGSSHAGSSRPLTRDVLVAVVGVVLLGLVGALVIPFTGDLPLTQALNRLNTGAVHVLANTLYQALEPLFAVLIAAAVAGLVAFRHRDLGAGLHVGLAVALTWLPVAAVKLALHRPRPAMDLLSHPTPVAPLDWSFPSGHVTFVAATALVLTLISRTRGSRAAAAVLGALAVVAMVAAVLILGVHYPTDALASIVWVLATGPLMVRLAAVPAGVLTRASRGDSRRPARSR